MSPPAACIRDCAGDWVAESRPVAPRRALRRVNAERVAPPGARGLRLSILRVPRHLCARSRAGTPDAAASRHPWCWPRPTMSIPTISMPTTWRVPAWPRCGVGRRSAPTNVADDSQLKMGDYFDLAADLYGLPRPPRAAQPGSNNGYPLSLLSLSESRRLVTTRMARELRLRLRYPNCIQGCCLGSAWVGIALGVVAAKHVAVGDLAPWRWRHGAGWHNHHRRGRSRAWRGRDGGRGGARCEPARPAQAGQIRLALGGVQPRLFVIHALAHGGQHLLRLLARFPA